MIKLIGILLLISAGVVVLTYNDLLKDENKDGILNAIEDKAKKVKEKIKKKIKKR